MLGGPIALALVFLILIGNLSESFAAWSAKYVHPVELFGALAAVLVLVLVLGPFIDGAEVALAMVDYIARGMH